MVPPVALQEAVVEQAVKVEQQIGQALVPGVRAAEVEQVVMLAMEVLERIKIEGPLQAVVVVGVGVQHSNSL